VVNSKPRKWYPSIYNNKDFKQKFLAGQMFDITEHVENKNPNSTTYQSEMKHKITEPAMKGPLKEKHSILFGGVIPDP
jgi:hypothetical protein